MTQLRRTKANTEFMEWWKLLNDELSKLHPGQQCGYGDAKGTYEEGICPEKAAQNLVAAWS